jgi:2-polyprenyl-3-methyl-5-hydroxy-6-metoxy-1,4-benzoquinol methylase
MKYEYDARARPTSAALKVVRMTGSNKRVLELGAGPGSIARILQNQGNCRVTAIEIDAVSIEKLAHFCENIYQCDLNDDKWTSLVSSNGEFQVVVAADVLEHLYHPEETLRAMGTLVGSDGYVVVSLPNIGHNGVIACMIQGDFAYGDVGLLDKTHLRFFGVKSIQRLFDEAGFTILEAEFVVRKPERTEFADFWRQLPAQQKRFLSGNHYGAIYQVVIKAKPALPYEQSLKLCELPVPTAFKDQFDGMTLSGAMVEFLKSLILPYISINTQQSIGRFLNRIGIKY